MIATMPAVAVGRPMDGAGEVVGFGRARAVWRFGFPPDSPEARAFGVYVDRPWYVLALHGGRVMAIERPRWSDPLTLLPPPFRHVLDAVL